MANQNDPIIQLPILNMWGFALSNDATTPNTILNIGPGVARDVNNEIDLSLGVDNPDLQGRTVATPLLVNTAVNGLNGLDTGTIAINTLYAVFLVGDSRYYKPTGVILTLASNAAPLLPFGYDTFRLIGFVAINGSGNILPFRQIGTGNFRQIIYAVGQSVLGSGNATSYANINLSNFVPPIQNTLVNLNAHITPAVAGDNLQVKDLAASTVQTQLYGPVATQLVGAQIQVLSQLDGSTPSVAYQVTASGDSADIWVLGYTFFV